MVDYTVVLIKPDLGGMLRYLDRLNTKQKQAVTMIKGPVLCLAGPGSGKTFTLVCRLRFLIEKHFVPPDSILVITYSKAAALSMQQRFNREMNGKSLPVVFGTFHALCFHILKQQYSFKLDSLLSYPERIQTIQSILQSMYIQSPDEEMCDAILGCISLYKNGKYSEELSLPMNMDREGFTRIYEEYCRRNWQKGKLDFDDMLFLCLELLQKKPTVLSYWQKRFSYILVDEFQDCNRIQYEIVKKLAASDENLFVVGDDDQSIYGFRGASPDILQLFLCDFPNAGQILLGGNYRSRPEIIEAAGRVIIQNEKRMNKTLYAAGGVELLAGREPVQIKCFEGYRMQSAYLTEQLKLLHTQIPWEEMAVIFRTNREMEMLFPFLQKEKIPCCIRGGMKNPYAHFVVQDILAYLRFASGEHSRKIFLQIMTKPERGISRELLWEEKVNFVKLEEELVLHHKREEAKAVRRLSSQFEKLNKMSPYLAIQFIRNAMGYERWLRGRAGEEVSAYEEWKERLDELQQSARNFTQIGEWLSFIEQKEKEVENIERGSVKEIQRGVNLLTFHGSKGLEFTYVCLPNLNEGKLPHGRMPDQAAVEEERRLFYVGMTRAKKALELLYLTGTKERPRQPSRFLQPLIMTDNYSFSSESNSSNS